MIRTEIAQILGTTEKNLDARLIGLRIAPVCERCGGCGRYSFNQVDGSRCYGCNGKGHIAPRERDLPAMLEAAREAAQDGRLDAYLEYLSALRVTKNATDRVMAAWKATGISNAYDWRKSFGADAHPRDRDIAAINARMAAAYDRVSKAAMALNPRKDTYRADVLALAAMVAEAMDTIEIAKSELDAYQSQEAAAH